MVTSVAAFVGGETLEHFLKPCQVNSYIAQNSIPMIIRIHIRTCGDEQFGDFLVTLLKPPYTQRSHPEHTLRIHIRASSLVLFDGFDVSTKTQHRELRCQESTHHTPPKARLRLL